MSDVFRKKCPGCNGIVEYHTTCVPCSQRKRTELHASGLCIMEEFDYRKSQLRTPNPRDKFAEFKKAYSPQTDLRFDSLREVYKPLTVTGSKYIHRSAMEVAEEHAQKEWIKGAQFRGSSTEVRGAQERSAEALLNFIEHSSKPLKDGKLRIEAKLYHMRAISPKTQPSFAVMAELFGSFVDIAVRTFRTDMIHQSEFKFGVDVRRHCVMRLIQGYQAGDRVGG